MAVAICKSMDAAKRTAAAIALGLSLGLGWGMGMPADAACLPGQTCWQVPQLQNNPPPSIPNDSAAQQVLQDRATVIQNQQKLTRDRAQLRTPPGTNTPLDVIQQRQQLRDDRDQLLQSQQSLQHSQQLLLDQQRPPAPTPYIVKPQGVMP